MPWCYNFLVALFLFQTYCEVSSSDGDRAPFYQNCVRNCVNNNCTEDGVSYNKQVLVQLKTWSLLTWGCKDECKYHCMWRTVQGFQERGWDMPKFHGKWPFIRILGVQEPASAASSLLNLAAHVYMYSQLRNRFSIKSTPLVLFWHGFAWVCMNAWIWSTIFHTRDNPFTEFMDYACALSMVMALFVAAVVRIFHRKRKLTVMLLLAALLYYIEHVRYLYTGRIDYDYNMIVNVTIGVIGSLLWLVWSCPLYVSGCVYTWRIICFTLLSGAALSLELLDFPPAYGLWDAHALWHLATAPLPILFYKFVIDDLNALQSSWPTEKTDLKQM